jgi:flagellar protein FlaJ
MTDLNNLREKIEEKKEKKTEQEQPKTEDYVDTNQVEKIVDRMKKKYKQEGLEFEKAKGELGELRDIIAEGEQEKLSVQRVEDLQEFQNPTIQSLGKFYLTFKTLLNPISNFFYKMPIASDVRYYLYSANMKMSLIQWLALSVSAATIAGFFTLTMATALVLTIEAPWFLPLILTPIVAAFTLIVALLIPKSNAQRRGIEISRELPFVLRHMATELKAGIGLYKSLQTIAASDYGVLSEEFGRTITEIEEGTDVKDALRHFALRTQSKALKNSLFHVIRAMKTGGSLSEIMNIIAEDVSFEMQVKIKDFSEKLNFFGVIFIFGAIVVPVFIAIIGAITNAPVSPGGINIPPIMLMVFYIIIMPFLLGFLAIFLKITQPQT